MFVSRYRHPPRDEAADKSYGANRCTAITHRRQRRKGTERGKISALGDGERFFASWNWDRIETSPRGSDEREVDEMRDDVGGPSRETDGNGCEGWAGVVLICHDNVAMLWGSPASRVNKSKLLVRGLMDLKENDKTTVS